MIQLKREPLSGCGQRSSVASPDGGQQSAVGGHPAVFLDRDGVVNKIVLCDGKPLSPRKLDEFVFIDGIHNMVDRLKGEGYKVIVITNQPDLARGLIAPETLERMTERMRKEICLDDVFICPHDDSDQCSCRKPKPGMLLEAARKWRIDLQSSFFVGDTWKDMDAGKAAGCKTILLGALYNQDVASDFKVSSLTEALSLILNLRGVP